MSVEVFQILKDDAVKALHSICQQIWKTHLWPQDRKRSVFIPIPKKGNSKECLNYHTTTHKQGSTQSSPSEAAKVHEPRTFRCSSWIQKRQKKQKSNCQHLLDHRKNKRIPGKHQLCFTDYTLKPLIVWITANCGKFFKRWGYQTTSPAS